MALGLALLAAIDACGELAPDDAYVRVLDGALHLDGERVRFWGTNGHTFARARVSDADDAETVRQKVDLARRSNDAILDRLEALGFNSVRIWAGFPGDGGPYTMGDGSLADSVDYFLDQAAQRGFKVWYAGWNKLDPVTPADVDVIDDPDTAEAWAAAVREACEFDDAGKLKRGWNLRNNIARIWDPRLEAIGLRQMTYSANHLNRYRGLRWADDPVFGVWELSNEEWWMRRMVGGRWKQLPAYFRGQLVDRWQAFLRQKYGDEAGLRAAWGGLLEGESLDKGTVVLAPMARPVDAAVGMNDQNPFAADALKSLGSEFGRDDLPEARGRDVLEFFMGLLLNHKQRSAAALKPLGKSTRLCPMIYDTGIGYEVQSQYLHQHADASAHDAYVNGFGPPLQAELAKADDAFNAHEHLRLTLEAERVSANNGPWVNWLRKPPAISQGVPWLEHNRVAGQPFFCYETNIMQPAKYRADFPLRLLALASIQDWDWVCWHYFGDGSLDRLADSPDHFSRTPMDVTTGSHPQGYHFTYDEVLSAMVRAAGVAFRSFAFAPAEQPTEFVYGRDALYDPASMDYGHSYCRLGMDMLQTVYQHGLRLRIDPALESSFATGPTVSFDDRHTHNPYTPTEGITFDWRRGFLFMDSPRAVMFAGSSAAVGGRVSTRHGVAVRDIRVDNEPGMLSPVEPEEGYVAIAYYSHDGLPLSETNDATISLVSTSFNTGLALRENGRARDAGRLPVLSARVSAVIEGDGLEGMRYEMLDWNLRRVDDGVIVGRTLIVPGDEPVFVVRLTRGDVSSR